MTIKEILERHHITQTALCRMLGIPKTTMAFWKSGMRTPPDYVLKLIAYYLDCELGVPASRENGNK